MSSRTLVTGFGAFGTVTENPSAWLAERCERPFQILPVEYAAVDRWIQDLDSQDFDRILMLGVAAQAKTLRLELQAHNWTSRMPDAAGERHASRRIQPGAPERVRSTLWTPVILRRILEVCPEVAKSRNAGSYLCNFASYRAGTACPIHRVGFLHVPLFTTVAAERQQEVLQSILSVIESD
jgi:pyroglutamyl-peptidase